MVIKSSILTGICTPAILAFSVRPLTSGSVYGRSLNISGILIADSDLCWEALLELKLNISVETDECLFKIEKRNAESRWKETRMVNGDWIFGISSSLAPLAALLGGRQVVGNHLLAVSFIQKLVILKYFKTHKKL